ncbi:hypothetical protein DBV05_g6282 [Lasiodiplodia theobromae]|uniref:Uncharacterized protein n=1 Tax=Lasiodiplodia theobromae TaxID=45133 RepID=A0A5N5DB80_9PEZI|nr:hypothetical protein DBV05_g6282 [Lasiodiplodia theobromae]
MCSYTYSWYYCNHDYYIWANSIEICPNRLLSGYSYDAWSIDMCKNMTVKCGGFSNYYCSDCSEDVALEYELDEIQRLRQDTTTPENGQKKETDN